MDIKIATNSSKLNNINDVIDEIEQQEGVDEKSDAIGNWGVPKQFFKTWFFDHFVSILKTNFQLTL